MHAPLFRDLTQNQNLIWQKGYNFMSHNKVWSEVALAGHCYNAASAASLHTCWNFCIDFQKGQGIYLRAQDFPARHRSSAFGG